MVPATIPGISTIRPAVRQAAPQPPSAPGFCRSPREHQWRRVDTYAVRTLRTVRLEPFSRPDSFTPDSGEGWGGLAAGHGHAPLGARLRRDARLRQRRRTRRSLRRANARPGRLPMRSGAAGAASHRHDAQGSSRHCAASRMHQRRWRTQPDSAKASDTSCMRKPRPISTSTRCSPA